MSAYDRAKSSGWAVASLLPSPSLQTSYTIPGNTIPAPARRKAPMNEERFWKRLEDSKEAHWRIGQWFFIQGYTVALCPPIKGQRDNGDIFIESRKGEWDRIEVKQRNFHFTSAHDFPHDDIFICNCLSWDRAKEKPHQYIICNQNITHAASINGLDSVGWLRKLITDNHLGETYFAYSCPKEKMEFFSLD